MKRIYSFLFLLLLLPVGMEAQNSKYTISGYVEDEASGEKLIGAAVFDANSGHGTTANEYGFFSLTLPAGEVQLTVSYVGYANNTQVLDLQSDQELDITLSSDLTIEEVTVTTNRPQDVVKSAQMSSVQLAPAQVKAMPSFLGESDVMKALQLMPGVQSGTEGSSGLYVRGGGPDQNLILLDGVPIYNANHLFGFFSVFNPDAISNVTLIKGGFPAHYGGRLSSVLDIRLKEGNSKEFHGSGSVGIISSRLLLEGPIKNEKTSFMISARRTYIDVLARPIIRIANNASGNEGMAGYFFYDANVKINHKFSNKDRIFLSAYSGRDKASIQDEYDYFMDDTVITSKDDMGLFWGNLTSVLRWNHKYGSKFFSNLSVFYSNYKFNIYEDYRTYKNDDLITRYSFEYFSGIEDIGGILDFDWYPAPNHSVKFGGKYLYHKFKPGVIGYQSTEELDSLNLEFGNEVINAQEFYVYAEDKMKIGDRLLLNLGAHYSAFMVQDQYYHSLQPRLSARFLVNSDLSVKAAFTQMQQYIHLLTNSTIGLPTDLWLPTTLKIPPENSWQSALGFAYNLNNEWTITLEGFYKSMQNLIEYKQGSSYLDLEVDWEDKVNSGHGWSYGVELFVQRQVGKLTGWLGYTLAKADREFPTEFGTIRYPYTYDRRHDVSLVAMYKFSERTDISLTWVYGTGRAVTLAESRFAPDYWSKYSGDGYWGYYDELQHYNGKNGYREPAYHRLDFAFNRHKEMPWGKQTWSFGAYNVYNRQNPFFLYFGRDWDGNRQLMQLSLFPLIPSISYSFNF